MESNITNLQINNGPKNAPVKHDNPKPHSFEKVNFFLTGFGSFGSIDNNPTSHLVNVVHVSNEPRACILSTERIQVSVEACKQYAREISGLYEQTKAKETNCLFVVINFGVNAGSSLINLEQMCYNNADFCIPDVLNFQPRSQKICPTMELSEPFRCRIDLPAIHSKLTSANQNKAVINNDPGSYICNYMYFNCSWKLSSPDLVTLFIHVPLFSAMEANQQINCIDEILECIAELYLAPAKAI